MGKKNQSSNISIEAFLAYEKRNYQPTNEGPKKVENERASFVDKKQNAAERYKKNLEKFEQLAQKEKASMVHVKNNHFLGR